MVAQMADPKRMSALHDKYAIDKQQEVGAFRIQTQCIVHHVMSSADVGDKLAYEKRNRNPWIPDRCRQDVQQNEQEGAKQYPKAPQ